MQVLDHGHTEIHEKSPGRKADWFTTEGDVFTGRHVDDENLRSRRVERPTEPSVGAAQPGDSGMEPPFHPCSGGEVRLRVNGRMVSGGRECDPATGYVCLESEGGLVDVRALQIRSLQCVSAAGFPVEAAEGILTSRTWNGSRTGRGFPSEFP